ncbi:hypothetical protein Egran_00318 [Elaphomyces granulatus]|uniref:Exonuclease domain-containing protein n=1 Tax=Elaphomyces granulatus TaxID=519963 RepID=A0A232M6A1_9EURO|nr:hypothetical protein Egran_00318 [Elaphomyces granulatus]
MFTPLGLFKDLSCPQDGSCSLLTCMFSHTGLSTALPDSTSWKNTPRVPRDQASPKETPDTKKRKVIAAGEKIQTDRKKLPSVPRHGEAEEQLCKNGTSQELSPAMPATSQDRKTLQSTTRTISPPLLHERPCSAKGTLTRSPPVATTQSPRGMIGASGLPLRQAPKETLNPRMISKAPAAHTVRSSILNKLHAAMSALNDKVANEKNGSKLQLILSRDELVTMALDEEEKAAKDNPVIYANVIKLRILKLQKMSQESWENEVLGHLNTRYYDKTDLGPGPKNGKELSTGLTVKQEIAIAAKFVTPLAGKEEFGYVTRVPTEKEIAAAREGVEASQGWEKCDRCGGRFQVFPGRREDGTLATGGQCTHHPGKLTRTLKKKTDRTKSRREAYFPCCNESVGTSAGCTKTAHHVFKVTDPKRLASILQFEETPVQMDKGPQRPVCFDCEMAYTTLGMELVRLTALSWPQGEELVDVLVHPMGEILDLNSHFSGIWPEHYANALPYDQQPSNDTASKGGDIGARPMRVVDSTAAARSLLFKFLQPDTPLIGHAIENDLNACRIVHPVIIDTVLLYSHPKGLPIRHGLRYLSKKYLESDIQTGGDRGHDSKEDARATGNLVRVKAAERWTALKGQGCIFEGEKLVCPADQGSRAGQKRKQPAD